LPTILDMSEQQEQALADAKSALELSARVPNRAVELANTALLYSKPGCTLTQAHAFAALGSAYTATGRFDEAIRYLHEAMNLAFENRLTHITARVHQARGWISYENGNPVEAFSDWQAALEYFRQVRDTRGVSWILMHYAASYETLGLIDHAIQCRVSAMDIAEQLNDNDAKYEQRIVLGATYLKRAWHHMILGEQGFAIIDAQVATSLTLGVIAKAQDDLSPQSLELAYRTLGESLILQRRTHDGLRNLYQALDASVRVGGYKSEARLQGAIGYAYFLDGQFDKACTSLAHAIEDAPSATCQEDHFILHRWYAQALQASKRHEDALAELWKAIEIESQLKQERTHYWSKMHDFTIGVNESLRDAIYVKQRENDWVFHEDELEAHCQRLAKLATTDPITHTLNRTAGLSELASRSYLHVAIFDITNLDYINGRFDRRVGDEVLANTASAIASAFGDQALICRFSGSEILVASDQTERFDVALQSVSGFPWIAIDPDLNVSITSRFVNPNQPHLLAA
jgi:tetratricopeptide (TPR) repeat protein